MTAKKTKQNNFAGNSTGPDEILHKQTEDALRERDELYRDLVENATDLICTHDLKGKLLSVNAAAARAGGFAAEEIVGLRIPDSLPPDRRQEFYDYIRDIQRDGTASGTMKIVTRNGGIRYWEYRNTLRTEGVPEPVVRGMARDVTGEVLAKRALKKSEKRYRLLFERNLAGVYRTTLDGRLLDCNDAFARIFGYDSRDETMQHAAVDFHVSPKAREDFIAALQTGGTLLDFESKGRRKDGNLIWLLESASLVAGEDAELTEIEGMLIDITERKRAEEAMRESEEKYRLTFNTSPDSVNINRLEDGLCMDINDGFTKLTGFTREDAIGRTSLEINIWDDPADRQKLVQGLREKGYYENLEARFRRKDGSIGTGLMSARVISLNEIPHIISITRDITERRRMEEELLKADKLESVGILAGGIAHDFNNILTTIIGNISLARLHVKPGSKVFDLLSLAETASMRASGLTGQLLTFARGGTPVKETASISSLIEESSLFVLQGSKSGCEFQIAEDLWPVEADVGQIRQAISNILINANQAMPEGGIVQVIAENLILEEK
ncbi:MAG: PAS domain S-box protein, partial [Desulfobacterales bacterium]|nr:PAS domain S-box protein [Desulfobacterales bacterium]